jgi:hypothetical protein
MEQTDIDKKIAEIEEEFFKAGEGDKDAWLAWLIDQLKACREASWDYLLSVFLYRKSDKDIEYFKHAFNKHIETWEKEKKMRGKP